MMTGLAVVSVGVLVAWMAASARAHLSQPLDVSLAEDTGALFYDTWLYLDEAPPPGARTATRAEAAARCNGTGIPYRPTNYRFVVSSLSSGDDVLAPPSLALGAVVPRDLAWYVCPDAAPDAWLPAAALCPGGTTYRRAPVCATGVWALVSAATDCGSNGVECTSCVRPASGCYCDGANPSDATDIAASALVVLFLLVERLLYLGPARVKTRGRRAAWVAAHACGATAQLLSLSMAADFYVRWHAPDRDHQAAAIGMAAAACLFCGLHIACHWLDRLVVLRAASVPLAALFFDLATVMELVAIQASAPVIASVATLYMLSVVALGASYAYDAWSLQWTALRVVDLAACPLYLAAHLATSCAARTRVDT